MSCRLLFSSVNDLVVGEDTLAILTKDGEVWKMDKQSGQFVSQPLLSHVRLVTLVGEVLTAVTMDSVVYTLNMRQEEQVVGRGMRVLKVRRKEIFWRGLWKSPRLLAPLAKQQLRCRSSCNSCGYSSSCCWLTLPSCFSLSCVWKL